MSGKLDRRTCGAYAIRPYSLTAGGVVPNDPQSVVVRVGAYGIRPLGRPLRGRMIKQWGTSTIIRKLGRHTCGTYPIPPPRLTSKRPAFSISPTPSHPQTGRFRHSPTPCRPQTGRLFHSLSPSQPQTARLFHSPSPSDPQTGCLCHSPSPSGSHFACKSASLTLKAYDMQRICDSNELEAYYMRCR